MKFSVPIGQRRQASAWKNRVLPVGGSDRNGVSCSDRDTAPVLSEDRTRANTSPAELSVLILFKMIESIDMTPLCHIFSCLYIYYSFTY